MSAYRSGVGIGRCCVRGCAGGDGCAGAGARVDGGVGEYEFGRTSVGERVGLGKASSGVGGWLPRWLSGWLAGRVGG